MRRRCLGAIFTGAALLLTGCRKQTAVEPSLQAVTADRVATIRPDTPERYSATVSPIAQVDLAFKSAGLVEKIYQVRGADGRMRNVQAGDKVARGTQLAVVRTTDYEQRVDQKAAQVAQSEAQVGQFEAQLAQARANFNQAEIEYARATNLFQSASLVKPRFDEAKGRYETVAASVKAAETSVKGGEAAVANAQAALSEAKLNLNDTSVRASFDGWISARNVDRGSSVSSTTVGFSMMDTHLVKAEFAVPDSSLKMVHLGQKLPVMLDAIQHAVKGVVTSISPQADLKTRVFSIEVTLDNPRDEVRPGMIGSLVLGVLPNPAPRLVVPLSAVVRAPSDPKNFAVFRLVTREGKTYAESQIIQIGQALGNSIEVTGGLSAGQPVIALGGSLVRDGEEVRVLP